MKRFLKQIFKKSMVLMTVHFLFIAQVSFAQNAAQDASTANNANFARTFGEKYGLSGPYATVLAQIVELVHPTPTGNYDAVKFQRQRTEQLLH